MELNISISKKTFFFIASVSLLFLASCGSYQYSGSDRDGIYGNSNRDYSEQEQYAVQDGGGNYYKKLFSEESALYSELLAEDAIFTDVESYSSTGGDYNGQQSNYQGGNAPWGQDPDSYSINIYNQGFYGGFYNPYWDGGFYGYNPYWGPGYYGPRHWGSSWSIGFGGYYPYYGHSYGYGFAVHPYFYGGGGWYNPYNYHSYKNYNFRQNVAHNTGRRNASTSYRTERSSNLRNATNLDSRSRNSSYSRSIRNLRDSDDQYGLTRRSATRDNSSSRVNSNNQYRSNRQQTTTRSTQNTNTQTRQTTTNRSNTGAARSSGTVRSSSEGRTSSGGNTTRGRGN